MTVGEVGGWVRVMFADADINAWIGHSLSISALIGVAMGFFTPLAALATTIWFCVQIWESQTVQGVRKRHRERRIARLELRLEELRGEDNN